MTSCGREMRFEKEKTVHIGIRYAGALGEVTNHNGKYTLTEDRLGHLQST
jgi:hypothetical protein